MSAPTPNSNLSLLVIPGFSLVGKMIDSWPDWTAVDFCALQSDSAGIRPITRSRAWRQGAGRLGGGPCGGFGQPVPAQVVVQHPLQPAVFSFSFFGRPRGTVSCGGGSRQPDTLEERQSDLACDGARNCVELRFSAIARYKQRDEKVTPMVWQQGSAEAGMTIGEASSSKGRVF